MAKKRIGRPPKDPEKRATDAFHFRVQAGHGEIIRQAAEHSGLGVSGWLRDRALKVARKELRSYDASRPVDTPTAIPGRFAERAKQRTVKVRHKRSSKD